MPASRRISKALSIVSKSRGPEAPARVSEPVPPSHRKARTFHNERIPTALLGDRRGVTEQLHGSEAARNRGGLCYHQGFGSRFVANGVGDGAAVFFLGGLRRPLALAPRPAGLR